MDGFKLIDNKRAIEAFGGDTHLSSVPGIVEKSSVVCSLEQFLSCPMSFSVFPCVITDWNEQNQLPRMDITRS